MTSSKCNIKFKWDAYVVTHKTSKQKMIAFLALIKFCEILKINNSTTAFQGNLWGLNSSRTAKFVLSQSEHDKHMWETLKRVEGLLKV